MLAKHSTTPIEQIRDDIERDKILTAEESLAYGLVDQIVSTRKSSVGRLTGVLAQVSRIPVGRPGPSDRVGPRGAHTGGPARYRR